MNKNLKKIFSLLLPVVFLFQSFAYADTVVIGMAPTSNATNKSIASNASGTMFLQNASTGPGAMNTPNSAMTGISPIQTNFVYDSAASAPKDVLIDGNNVADSGPVTQNIASPAANNYAMSQTTSKVIDNGVLSYQNKVQSSTEDKGPTSYEIQSPTDGVGGVFSEGAIGPGFDTRESQKDALTNIATSQSQNTQDIPSYTTGNYVNNNANNLNQGVIIYQCNNNITAAKPAVYASAGLVVNATTRQIYFSKDGFGSYAPAGLTNLVTGSILLSYRGLDDVLTVSRNAVTGLESGATTAGLKEGDTITVRDALAALYISSCCDVANVIAENVAGNIPQFVALMNQTARDWGCISTTFTNPTGLNDANQRTTVYDMAIVMDKACSNPTLEYFLNLTSHTLPATLHRSAKRLTSKNNLITKGNKNYYNGISASRMGYTSLAKYTMASEVDINGQRLIAVVLKANGTQYADTKRMLDFAMKACVEAAGAGAITTNTNAIIQQPAPQANAMTAYGAPTKMTANANINTNASGNAQIFNAGDTVGTWGTDESGPIFIKADGTRAINEWVKQYGKLYCFDNAGKLVTGWCQMSNGKVYYFDQNSGEFRYGTWVNTSTGAYYLEADGALAKADKGSTKNIVTNVGTYTIDENGKALARIG